MAIVIPAYKGRFLKETLDSIAVQAHKDEFVLYIGDDASPERLDKIVESYQNKVNLVYHRFSENMGGKDLVAHWERCIQLSAEPFIWLFSDDDLMPADGVERASRHRQILLCSGHSFSACADRSGRAVLSCRQPSL